MTARMRAATTNQAGSRLRVRRQPFEVALEVKLLRSLDAVQHSLVDFPFHILAVDHARVDATDKLWLVVRISLQGLESGVNKLHYVAKEALSVLAGLPVADDVVQLVCEMR